MNIYQSHNSLRRREWTRILQKPISLDWVSSSSSCTHSAMWNESVSHEKRYSHNLQIPPTYWCYVMTSWGEHWQETVFPTTKNPVWYRRGLYFLWLIHKSKQVSASVCSGRVHSKTSVKAQGKNTFTSQSAFSFCGTSNLQLTRLESFRNEGLVFSK